MDHLVLPPGWVENSKKEGEQIMDSSSAIQLLPKGFNDELFAEGNEICGIYSKTCIIDEDDEDFCHKQIKEFKCDIPNCDLVFDNLLKYELHYNSCHRFSCSQCKKHLPSPHLLDLHLMEAHDSFFKVQAERKPMFRCIVESCSVMSNDAASRKKHCIEVHEFPHDFHFESKKKQSHNSKEKKSRVPSIKNGDATGTTTDSKEKIKKHPHTFGRKTGGKSFGKTSQKLETSIQMGELMDTLPNV